MPEITVMEDIEPERVDLVKAPANGFPFLVMKAVATPPEIAETQDGPNGHTAENPDKGCGCCEDCVNEDGCACCSDCAFPVVTKDVNASGGVDEKPDIQGAQTVLQGLARLIEAEAREMAVGNWDEVNDVQLLAEAACLMRCFMSMEMWGDEDDGVAKDLLSEEDVKTFLAKRKVSTAERKRLASEGKALSDGSYPIDNEEDLHNAAILARSGHGDVAGAKRLIAKRAKELGVANPLADDAKKDAEPEAPEAANTETSEPEAQDQPETAVKEDASVEAIKALEGRVEAAEAELAKMRATPIPGGPLTSVPPSMRDSQDKDNHLAKAHEYERLADLISEPAMKTEYKTRARAEREAAGVPSQS